MSWRTALLAAFVLLCGAPGCGGDRRVVRVQEAEGSALICALRAQAALDPSRQVLPPGRQLETHEVLPHLESPDVEVRRLAALFLANRRVRLPNRMIVALSQSKAAADRLVGYYVMMRQRAGSAEEVVWDAVFREADPEVQRELFEEMLPRLQYCTDGRILELLRLLMERESDVGRRMHLVAVAQRLLPKHLSGINRDSDLDAQYKEVLAILGAQVYKWDAKAGSFEGEFDWPGGR